MVWLLSVVCIALYALGVVGMGALCISIIKSKGLEPSQHETVRFALLWPFIVIKNLF